MGPLGGTYTGPLLTNLLFIWGRGVPPYEDARPMTFAPLLSVTFVEDSGAPLSLACKLRC